MNKDIIVVPFIETIQSERFGIFLSTKFDIKFINNNSDEKLFEDWRNRGESNGWSKFVNDEYCLEFFPTHYTLNGVKPGNSISYNLKIPATINDFINDMERYNVQLIWNNIIDIKFEPKEYLALKMIKPYFGDLLKSMDKSHELQ